MDPTRQFLDLDSTIDEAQVTPFRHLRKNPLKRRRIVRTRQCHRRNRRRRVSKEFQSFSTGLCRLIDEGLVLVMITILFIYRVYSGSGGETVIPKPPCRRRDHVRRNHCDTDTLQSECTIQMEANERRTRSLMGVTRHLPLLDSVRYL